MSVQPSPLPTTPPSECLVHEIGTRVVRVVPPRDPGLGGAGLGNALASLRADVNLVVIDLRGLERVDGDGTHSLLDAAVAHAREGRRLVVVNGPDLHAQFERLGVAPHVITIVRPVSDSPQDPSVNPDLATQDQLPVEPRAVRRFPFVSRRSARLRRDGSAPVTQERAY